MKRCPKCGQTYNDGSLNFCLMDGAPLGPMGGESTVVSGNSPSSIPTVQAGAPTDTTRTIQRPPRRGSSMAFWIVLLILVILLGGAGFVGLLVYISRQGDHSVATSPANVRSPSPSRSPTPRPSPSPSVSPSPSPGRSATPAELDDGDTDGDEITPIAWNTSAAAFKNDIGTTYSFQCPPNGSPVAIW